MQPTKILMVEDDPNLGYLMVENFKQKGMDIHLCNNGEEGLDVFSKLNFQLCILDVMLPKKDGFSLAKEIRRKDNDIPIIFLTAKTNDEDKLKGFDIGGDDYVTKPFSAQELYMRIKAILRRSIKDDTTQLFQVEWNFGMFNFNYNERILICEGQQRRLSTKEAEMLKMFIENKNTLISRKDILLKIWGTDDYFTSKSMDVYLTRLRKMLKDDKNVEIKNIHGTGFKLIVN